MFKNVFVLLIWNLYVYNLNYLKLFPLQKIVNFAVKNINEFNVKLKRKVTKKC